MSRRAILIALFVSLAVNLFLVGGLVGGLLIGGKMHHMRAPMRGGPPLWAAADSLKPEQRKAYRMALRGEAGAVGASLRDVRQARSQAWTELGADPLDTKAVIADLDRARAREMEARSAVERRIVDFAATLPPQDRAQLAQALAKGPGRGEPKRH